MIDGSTLSAKNGRARGLDLLRQVYDELYTHLADEFSPAELLRAAQTLIEATDEEYSASTYQDGQLHPGYYSFEVDTMIPIHEWLILSNERNHDDFDDDQIVSERETIAKLKRFYNPDPYFHRG